MRVVAQVGASIASVGRALVILVVASVSVIAYTACSPRWLLVRDATARCRTRARYRGRLLRWSFACLGGTFVKIGQVASSRPDLFAPCVIDELRSLQDHVPPFAFRHVRAVLTRELRVPLATIFSEIDPTPLAAGSVAQVHRGVLVTGEEVAIKVLRPGIRARVRRDARLLLWLAHVAHAVCARARAADVIGHVRALITGIVAQTELRHEALNHQRFRTEFAETDGLAFPYIYSDHSTRDVLVMEMIHGVTLDRIPADHREQVMHVLRDAFFAMCFEHGLVHADLHPGNVLVRDDATVVLLDAGLVKHLRPHVIDQVVELARCMVMGTASDLVVHLRKHHGHAATTDWAAVEKDAIAFIGNLRQRCISEIELSVVVGQLFALARKHRIRPLPQLSLVLLGMVTMEGIAKHLTPPANMTAEVAAFLGPRLAIPTQRLARGSGRWSPPAHHVTLPAARVAPAPAVAPLLGEEPIRPTRNGGAGS